MKLFILTHTHKFGSTLYLFHSKKNRNISINSECYEDREDIEDIIKHFKIDFENRYEESIDIESYRKKDISTLLFLTILDSDYNTLLSTLNGCFWFG